MIFRKQEASFRLSGCGRDGLGPASGAIISGGWGIATEKVAALRVAGVLVADSPALIGETLVQTIEG